MVEPFLRKSLSESKVPPSLFPAKWEPYIKKGKDSIPKKLRRSPQKSVLTGPYFPTLSPPSQTTPMSQTSSMLQVSGIESTHAKATATSSQITPFVSADVTDRKGICSRIQEAIKQLGHDYIKPQLTKELMALATIPDAEIFIDIINQMLMALRDSPILLKEVLQGLAVVLNSCPRQIDLTDREGYFVDILKPLKDRLEVILPKKNGHQLLSLLLALCALLDLMVLKRMPALDRKSIHTPLNAILDRFIPHEDATVHFLAHSAKQALAFIGDDESPVMSFIRHCKQLIVVAGNTASGFRCMDPGKIASAYQNTTNMFDFSVLNDWYEGLVGVDCLLGLQSWPEFEALVIESKFSSEEHFLQGVCLRLARIMAAQASEEISCSALRLLRDLETKSTEQVQQVARGALMRLGMNYEPEQSTTKDIAQVIPGPASCVLPQASRDDLPPVLDSHQSASPSSIPIEIFQDSEQRHTNMETLLTQVKSTDIVLQTCNSRLKDATEDGSDQPEANLVQFQINIGEVAYNSHLPSPSSLEEVRTALFAYYNPYLAIQRVSGDRLGLESMYINLENVEVSAQRQKHKKERKAQALPHMPSYEKITETSVISSIPFEKLFNKRQLRDGRVDVPKTILIHGRAGIGKTTLCKKLVQAYQCGLWKDRFDAIIWLPLRQLRAFRARNLEDLLFTDTREVDDIVLEAFLKHLLQQVHVVITSRPSGVDMSLLPKLDQELETVGFSSHNVKDYVLQVLNPGAAREVRDFIQRTPLIQGLVNIPVLLDVICYSWDSIHSNGSDATMTELYSAMVQKLWRKDVVRLQKKLPRGNLTPAQINMLRTYQIEKLMADESEYLSYLAFKGMKNNRQIEFDEAALLDTMMELDYHCEQANQEPLSFQLLDALKQTSFLHTADVDLDDSKDVSLHAWHFLHLTFQEYFAAAWLARHLQNKPVNSTGCSTLMMTMEETTAFIQQYKLDPRYEIVWWMVAGQLEGEALESFFNLLQEAPYDLIGGRHQQLLAGCLKEARPRLSDESVERLEAKQSVFPEELLVKCLTQTEATKATQKYILEALKCRIHLTSSTIEVLVCFLQDTNQEIKVSAIETLSTQYMLEESTATALVDTLQDSEPRIKRLAAQALSTQSLLSESVILALISALRGEDSDVRGSAAKALGTQATLSDSATLALMNALQHKNSEIKYSAGRVFGTLAELPEFAIPALTNALRDDDGRVRSLAAKALATQSTLRESSIRDLIDALQNEDSEVRSSVSKALCSLSTLPESAILTLVRALRDKRDYVSTSAAQVLSSRPTLPESAILALVSALQDKDPNCRSSATEVLRTQSSLSEPTFLALTQALQDEDGDVRSSVAKALGAQATLPEFTVLALINALQDKCFYVKSSAVEAIAVQSILSESATLALIGALQHGDSDVRYSAAQVFGAQATLPESAIPYLTAALHDGYWHIGSSAAKALGNHTALPESIITTLIGNLYHGDQKVTNIAAKALATQLTLSESAILKLINVLRNEYCVVRAPVTKALCIQSTLPETAVLALANALQHDNSDVRYSAAQVLGTQATLPESTIPTFIKALSDSDWRVRSIAMEALCTQAILYKSIIQLLLDALRHNDWRVRRSAAGAIGAQAILSESTILSLISSLRSKDPYVTHSVIRALVSQATLPESAIQALIGVLKDEVRGEKNPAIEVFDKHHYSMCMTLPKLSKYEISLLCKNYLLRYGGVSLYAQDNRICFYTERGYGQTGPMSSKKLEDIMSVFSVEQTATGIHSVPCALRMVSPVVDLFLNTLQQGIFPLGLYCVAYSLAKVIN
ncbi:hypothetical protein BGX26_006819 [Mortierella sp. AD094]|nr:hypothetical protein BGX26_006819 [Mortierella sp. AD094]